MRGESYLVVNDQQAAALMRLGVNGVQFEGGRMRWWLPGGLRVELVGTRWQLYVVPSRS